MRLSTRQQIAVSILAILVVGLLWVIVGDLRDRNRVAEHRAKMQAAGEPATIADLVPAAVSPQLNAAVLLDQARPDIAALEKDLSSRVKTLSDAEQAAFHADVPSEQASAILRETLGAHPKAIEQILAATECPHLQPAFDVNSPLADFSKQLLPFIQLERSAFRVLQARATVQLADGDQQGAFETCLAIQRLARLTEQNSLLVGQLVAFALRGVAVDTTNHVLRAGPLSEEAQARLEEELDREDALESFRTTLRCERVRSLDRFGETMEVSEPVAWLLAMFVDESEYIDFLNLAIEQADKPFRDSSLEVEEAYQASGMLTRQLAPSIRPSLGSLARAQTVTRCLRVLNQLLKQDPDGTKGLTIDQLGLPAEATIDPYDGQPLRIKHGAEGWTVYSVGQNFQDDGGRLDDQTGGGQIDVGVGPVEPSP